MKLRPLHDCLAWPDRLYVVMGGEDEWLGKNGQLYGHTLKFDVWKVGVDRHGVAWTYCENE